MNAKYKLIYEVVSKFLSEEDINSLFERQAEDAYSLRFNLEEPYHGWDSSPTEESFNDALSHHFS